MSNNQQSSYYLKTVLILLANAYKYLEMFRIESGIKGTDKHVVNFHLNKIKSVDMDMRMRTSPEFAEIIRKEITDNWETLAVQNVLGMMVQMTDEQRRQVEEYSEKILTS